MEEAYNILNLAGKILHEIWHYTLLTISGNSVRVSNIIMAIALFLLGFKYSGHFSKYVKNCIKSKINSDKDAANAIEKLILYTALCIYAVTILEIAHVPLKTFAFIGGALAIGIGLGAQSIIGNFISSLIIMIERPLKIGDIVEMEGVLGTVTSVGARCVVLNTFSNVEVLIPNSKLMQNSLVNWTLTDSAIKHQVEISTPKTSKFNYQEFIKALKTVIDNLEFAHQHTDETEIYLTKIDSHQFTFLINFYCNIAQFQNPEYVKGTLNIALLEHLKDYEFTVIYPKIVELKPLSDKSDKTPGD